MTKKFLSVAAAVLVSAAVAAHADTFTFTANSCSSGCTVLPAGTVTLTQNGTGDVLVQVALTSDYSFRDAPGGSSGSHQAFDFDLAATTGVTIANLSSGPTSQTFSYLGHGSQSEAGIATFDYGFQCTTCAPGATATPTQTLQFDVLASGLTVSSFLSTGGYYFGADLVQLDGGGDNVGSTGNFGATLTSTTPPPSDRSGTFIADAAWHRCSRCSRDGAPPSDCVVHLALGSPLSVPSLIGFLQGPRVRGLLGLGSFHTRIFLLHSWCTP